MSSMTANLRPAEASLPGPTTGHAALILSRLTERRSLLARHNPAAAALAAEVLAAMHETAHGHAAALCCDRTPRGRIAQFMAEKPLAVEDQAAIALESEHGRAAVLAGLRVLAHALGHELRPVNARVESLHEAVAAGLERCSELFAGVTRDAASRGAFEPHEAERWEPVVAQCQEALTGLLLAMQHAACPQFYRPTRATKVTA